ncbi:hypothetical protein PYW08_000238 [Mythimna loreyi]|uniref:Uncharacterized protein n=4 Tax=Mythimna loreyi TaxID=667449 RepID=A0ACC2QPE1_9NEOP|nr:hypothetical protein PYW08_010100 [Mythimna loreyi]KAJ8716212.1 hypothetical protein PYW08_013497 [Mythimna loreyi]KAJ8719601.1 hypothetical protein PYW08_011776 [Mythimna loreyi]KAJ8737643.1 hypothetical protein PYW08_000238 [Mythimna loreyi]
MPLLQRDDEQRPRTRRQTEMDAARHRLEEEDPAGVGATAAAEMPTGPTSEMSLAAVLAAMQASMEAVRREQEANQRQLQDLIAANQEEARREQEAARREQEANQRQLQDLIAANQEEARREQEAARREQEAARREQEAARRDQEAKQNLILEKIDHGLVTLGEKVKNLTLEVKEVSARTDTLETRIDGHEDRLLDINRKIVKLEAREPIAIGSSAHTHCTSAAKFDVPRFDGTSSWTAFKYQFETLVKTNRWDDEQSFAALTLALRGDALLVLENLPSDGRTLERLMEGLDTRYGDKHLEHVFRAQLRERTQKPNESLQQWGVEVERLVRRAYVSMTPETVEVYLVQAFIDGLRDTEVRATVRLGHHQTLKSAMAHALEVEAVRQDSRTHRVREVVVSPSVQPRQREGVVSSSAKSRYIPTCYGCGEKGHIRTDCPKRKRGSVDSGTQVNEESLN